MQRYLKSTQLWTIYPDGRRFLMNDIGPSSKFDSVSLSRNEKSNQHAPEVQLKIARDLRDGWAFCGPYPQNSYEIVQKWTDGDVVVK